MSYFDHLKFKEMSDQPDYHFRNKKVVNFDIIHTNVEEILYKKSYKEYQTVHNDNFKKYPDQEKIRLFLQYLETKGTTFGSKETLCLNISIKIFNYFFDLFFLL